MEFSIYGAMQCLQLSEKRHVLEIAQSVSNLLLILYAMSYIFIKKVDFLLAFLFVECLAVSSVVSGLSSAEFYLFFSFLYSLMYWYIYKRYHMVKTCFGYGILTLFEGVMAIDAYAYPNAETYIDQSYTYIVVLVHLYIIVTLVDWRSLRTILGESIRALGRGMGVNYNLSFIWYTRIIYKQQIVQV